MSHTIAENLTRLQTAKENIASAIIAQGGTVSAGAGFEDFPEAITALPSGGGISIPPFIGNTILSSGSIGGIAGEVTVTEVN